MHCLLSNLYNFPNFNTNNVLSQCKYTYSSKRKATLNILCYSTPFQNLVSVIASQISKLTLQHFICYAVCQKLYDVNFKVIMRLFILQCTSKRLQQYCLDQYTYNLTQASFKHECFLFFLIKNTI